MSQAGKSLTASVSELKSTVLALADKVEKMSVRHAREERDRAARIAQEDRDLTTMSADLHELRVQVQSLIQMANRWKGGFIAIAGLGGVVGWVLTSWESVIYIFNKR